MMVLSDKLSGGVSTLERTTNNIQTLLFSFVVWLWQKSTGQ